jgi:HPt (histidine-containing phosphotransfer) domain-containing protein
MMEALDRNRLRALCGDNAALAADLIAMLIVDAEGVVAGLEVQSHRRNAGQVAELAHALKGVAANVGACELRDAAEALQNAATGGAVLTPSSYADHLDAIRGALERVRNAAVP